MTGSSQPGPLLVLIGPPGAGKSTVGPLLAERLGVSFRDTDRDLEAHCGVDVGDLLIEAGEPAFRAQEQAVVTEALAVHRGVLALGSGAVLSAPVRERLAQLRVVFLAAGPAVVAKRMGLLRDRPVLALNPRAQLRAQLQERLPLYAQLAQVRVDTDKLSADEVAEAVLAAMAVP